MAQNFPKTPTLTVSFNVFSPGVWKDGPLGSPRRINRHPQTLSGALGAFRVLSHNACLGGFLDSWIAVGWFWGCILVQFGIDFLDRVRNFTKTFGPDEYAVPANQIMTRVIQNQI